MSVENARIILYGLLDSCPFTYDDDCPIREQRRMPDEQKLDWARSLPEEEVTAIIEQHETCFWKRMENEHK